MMQLVRRIRKPVTAGRERHQRGSGSERVPTAIVRITAVTGVRGETAIVPVGRHAMRHCRRTRILVSEHPLQVPAKTLLVAVTGIGVPAGTADRLVLRSRVVLRLRASTCFVTGRAARIIHPRSHPMCPGSGQVQSIGHPGTMSRTMILVPRSRESTHPVQTVIPRAGIASAVRVDADGGVVAVGEDLRIQEARRHHPGHPGHDGGKRCR